MELDKRIKDIYTIQTILKYDVNHIGCKGYFFDMLWQIEDLSKCCYGKLVDIDEDSEDQLFKSINGKGNINFFRFFISENDLKPIEKKYRPFALEEFLKVFDVGDQIEFRCKDNGEVKHAMFIGYSTVFFADTDSNDNKKIPGENDVMIGIYRYSLAYLFENYELFFMGHWQPFGVIEDD